MATVILSAASPAFPSLVSLRGELQAHLASRGEEEVRTFDVASVKLAYCQGEFDCWVKTPGVCRSKDLVQDIVQAIHDADQLILLDAVTFGGHSHPLKLAQDRLICLLSPFFEKRASLTHHAFRYDHAPRFYALGWMPSLDQDLAATWNELADANAVNTLAPVVGTAVVDDGGRAGWADAIQGMLASTRIPGELIQGRDQLTQALLDAAQPAPLPTPPVPAHTAAILVGSAKVKGTSASENMARCLASRLQAAGVSTEMHFATDFVREGDKAVNAARSIAAADLFFVVTPLYVDAFPALATHALQMVASARAGCAPGARFVVVVNCGFPEAEQNRTALRIGRHFCNAAGYHWAGGLALGGGGAVAPDVPLDQQHGPADHVRRALEMAVPLLVAGGGIPAAAALEMAKAPMPDLAYRIIGDLGWRYQAWLKGVGQGELRARPLDLFE